jgi:signal transduction histidine kinase
LAVPDLCIRQSGAGLPLERRPMNLQDVCRQVVEELELQHSMPGRFRCEFHGNLNGAWDASRLAQLVSNLGGNAIEHGAPDTPIDIRMHDEGEEVLLEMHNQGPPITSELLPFVFVPFRQASGQKGAKSGGLGLGLYISDQIVRGHRGSIVALFSALVPTIPRPTAKPSASSDSAARLGIQTALSDLGVSRSSTSGQAQARCMNNVFGTHT